MILVLCNLYLLYWYFFVVYLFEKCILVFDSKSADFVKLVVFYLVKKMVLFLVEVDNIIDVS